MAARYTDGADHYTAMLENWTNVVGGVSISAGNGRRGSASFRLLPAGGVAYFEKTFDSQATWTIGMAVRLSTFTPTPIILQLLDSATEHIRLQVNGSGQLIVSRAGTTLGTSSAGLTLNTFAYVELKVTINDSTGAFDAKIGGTSVVSGSNVDTRNGANASANTIRFGSGVATSAMTTDIDDIYILDGQGSAPLNTFLGDCKPIVLLPSATGNANVWTPSTGIAADSWQLLDENPPNGDTDYISSAVVGDKTLTGYTDVPNSAGVIHFVQIATYGRKDDAGTRTICHVTRRASTDYDSANFNLPDAYAFQNSIREVDPSTSAAWTIANLNAAEHGVKVIA